MGVETKTKEEVASELLGIRMSVLRFALAMEAKLREHDEDRGERGWIDDDPWPLLNRALEEVEELRIALVDVDLSLDEFVEQRARGECADVGNFLCMIFDVLGHQSGQQ